MTAATAVLLLHPRADQRVVDENAFLPLLQWLLMVVLPLPARIESFHARGSVCRKER